jgi:hypothetical protein
MASSIGFFVWNYDGTKFSKIGLTKKAGIHIPTDKEKYGTACLIGVSHNAPMVWPAINGHPHDESNWDFFYCPEGKVYNSIQNKCLSCAPTTFALNKDTCSICPLGKTTHENHKAMSPLDCVDCSVGKKGLGTGGCELCTSGKYNDKTGAISCKFCSLGSDTGNLFGMFSCSKCSVGRYGQTLGSCTDCLPGFYSEELGNIACNECPKDTFNYVFGAANVAMCLSCPEDRSTNGATGQTNNTACQCRSTPTINAPNAYYMNMNKSCKLCPEGGDCYLNNGMLSEIFPRNGFWQSEIKPSLFIDCSVVRKTDAKTRCCPTIVSTSPPVVKVEGCSCQDEWTYLGKQ